jgi:hypothetical protein
MRDLGPRPTNAEMAQLVAMLDARPAVYAGALQVVADILS